MATLSKTTQWNITSSHTLQQGSAKPSRSTTTWWCGSWVNENFSTDAPTSTAVARQSISQTGSTLLQPTQAGASDLAPYKNGTTTVQSTIAVLQTRTTTLRRPAFNATEVQGTIIIQTTIVTATQTRTNGTYVNLQRLTEVKQVKGGQTLPLETRTLVVNFTETKIATEVVTRTEGSSSVRPTCDQVTCPDNMGQTGAMTVSARPQMLAQVNSMTANSLGVEPSTIISDTAAEDKPSATIVEIAEGPTSSSIMDLEAVEMLALISQLIDAVTTQTTTSATTTQTATSEQIISIVSNTAEDVSTSVTSLAILPSTIQTIISPPVSSQSPTTTTEVSPTPATPSTHNDPAKKVTIIAGCSAAVVALICVLVLCWYFSARRQKKRDKKGKGKANGRWWSEPQYDLEALPRNSYRTKPTLPDFVDRGPDYPYIGAGRKSNAEVPLRDRPIIGAGSSTAIRHGDSSGTRAPAGKAPGLNRASAGSSIYSELRGLSIPGGSASAISRSGSASRPTNPFSPPVPAIPEQSVTRNYHKPYGVGVHEPNDQDEISRMGSTTSGGVSELGANARSQVPRYIFE